MSDHVKLGGWFKVTHLKHGEHTFVVPFDDDCARLIGQIVVCWGAFEVRMDATISHVHEVMKVTPPKGWKRLSFRKRKVLFKDIMRTYTKIMFPQFTDAFDNIADKSGDLHWRRNVVTHGYYETLPGKEVGADGARKPRFVATGTIKGQKRAIEIDVPTLEKLWHDISHLVGALMATLNQMGGQASGFDLVIPDTDLLQDQESGNFRILATRDTP